MAATNQTYLPTYEELYVPTLNLTSSALKAGAYHFGVYCDIPSKEFMLCKSEEKDPRKCLKYNRDLSKCANDFFHVVRENCAESFTNYWKCLDTTPNGQMSYKFCRKTQAEYDNCMKEKAKINRPEIGWLSKIKLYESERPKPIEKVFQYETLPDTPEINSANLSKHPEAKDSLRRQNKI